MKTEPNNANELATDADRVVVIGGGIIGAMCAWYLTESGRSVVIVDRGRFGRGCSHGNCGYVSPSHILPLTTPGAVSMALRSMLSSESPFYVKPRWSWEMISWLWRFSRRCNRRDMLRAADALHVLLQSAKSLYRELIARESLACQWQETGIYFVFHDARKFEAYAATDRLLGERYGVSAQPLDAAALASAEPSLHPGLGGAWLYDCDAQLRPDVLLSQLRSRLAARGVHFFEETEVTGFERTGKRAQAVQTTRGQIAGHTFVVATGAWTPFLNRWLGCRVPIQPGKGYSLTMPRPALCPARSMIFEEHRVALTPFQDALRIGSTMEFAGYDTSINPRRLEILKKAARLYLREPNLESVQEVWYGWRPMTWNSLPCIDRAPSMDNVWIAAGHNMLGLSLGTVTGKLIAELIAGDQPHLDTRPYSLP